MAEPADHLRIVATITRELRGFGLEPVLEDLLRLKRTAAAARSVPGDADDIAFLESRKRDAG